MVTTGENDGCTDNISHEPLCCLKLAFLRAELLGQLQLKGGGGGGGQVFFRVIISFG